MGKISLGPTRWPPGAERRLVPAIPNLKPPTKARTRLYELAKWEMGTDEDDLHRSHDGLASAKWETRSKARLWRAMVHTFQKHGASMDLGRLRAGLAPPLTEVKSRASHTF